MCGLAGLFCLSGVGADVSALQAANDIAMHRGPDGVGFALFDTRRPEERLLYTDHEMIPDESRMGSMTLAMAHRRLAIIDLSAAGAQPMANEDETVWIIFNGEIYNFHELRTELEKAGHVFRSRSDTEVILHAYETWGEDCVHRFVGMWAFALADLKQRKLLCSRDRFGIKPFHYYYDGQRFAFGSEIKQVLLFPFVGRRVNEKAVYEYLAYEGIDWGEQTFFADVFKLLPGSNLILDLKNAALTKAQYYSPEFAIDTRINLAEAVQEFRRLFTESVRVHLRSDVKVGSCLSGGLDSSSIVCLMRQLLDEEGKTEHQYTFSSHFEEEEANELEYTQEVINSTGVHAEFTYPTEGDLAGELARLIWHQEEPFSSTSIFAQWSVFKLIHRNGVKVVLDGQGADEQLAGYVSFAPYYFLELQAKHEYGRLLSETLCHARLQGKSWLNLLPGKTGALGRKLFGRREMGVSAPPIDWINPGIVARCKDGAGYVANLNVKPFAGAEYLNNVLYQFTFLNNLPQLLKYEDRNSMAFSVESRVPFLDHRLVEFVFSLPSHFKIRCGQTKYIMREAMAGTIPEKIRRRARKMGFATPERLWQRNVLRPLVGRALRDDRLSAYIIPGKAESYFAFLERYSILNFSPWRWVNLLLWMEAYGLA